ncbi:MAG TPA: hypothetical protein VEH04_01395 [Verrucomicrobiae bacterium]|nr:hypothetical protein [Verrucomicrobiae bacterium]
MTRDDSQSVYPDLMRSGLERLKTLDANREMLGLFAALEHFRRDLHEQENTAGILDVTGEYVRGLALFHAFGFWLVNPGDFSFEPALVIPASEQVTLWRIVEQEIKSGSFARALRQDDSTFFNTEFNNVASSCVFRPLKLSAQVLGMFCGLLKPDAVHQVTFSVLAVLLGESTDAMATLRRTRQLTTHIDLLDGLLPFCAWCKKVRNDQGYWEQIERYIAQNSRTSVTHGVCPDCRKKFLEGVASPRPQ